MGISVILAPLSPTSAVSVFSLQSSVGSRQSSVGSLQSAVASRQSDCDRRRAVGVILAECPYRHCFERCE